MRDGTRFSTLPFEISVELPAGAVRDGGGDLLLPSPGPWRATTTPDQHPRTHANWNLFSALQ